MLKNLVTGLEGGEIYPVADPCLSSSAVQLRTYAFTWKASA
jgi:hypothetical protein